MASKRLCEYTDHFGKRFRGVFHRWGDSYIVGKDDTEVPVTIAIVEVFETGEVLTLRPKEIKFLPPPGFEDPSPESLRLASLLADK
jgi:hypothetical protein